MINHHTVVNDLTWFVQIKSKWNIKKYFLNNQQNCKNYSLRPNKKGKLNNMLFILGQRTAKI